MYRVLIVDDDVLMCQALNIMVSRDSRFKVVDVVNSGEKAVQVCKKNRIDLIFMDMQMSGITGLEASRIILQSHPECAIYILSAHPANVISRSITKENIKSVIEKPINNETLKRILENYKTEHEDSAQIQLEFLLNVLQDRDFSKLYSNIGRIVDEVYELIGNDSVRLNKIFTFIGQTLLDTIDFYDCGNKSIESLFPINEGLILDRKTTEIWLFRIMDYLFQKNSINRYPLLENIFLYIEKNIKEEISLNKIIDNCSISQGYLSRLFREQFQTSVMEYLHMRKLHLAKAYFYFTEDSIAEVAFRLGYNESSYFSKVFKKYENITVKQYKNIICGKRTS